MGKKSPAPPPAPDYAGAAQQQGIANLDAARLTARLSNPNIRTPLGGQRVTFGRPQVNQAAYNAAMADWKARQKPATPTTPPTGTTGVPPTTPMGGGNQAAMQQSMAQQGGVSGGGSLAGLLGSNAPTTPYSNKNENPYANETAEQYQNRVALLTGQAFSQQKIPRTDTNAGMRGGLEGQPMGGGMYGGTTGTPPVQAGEPKQTATTGEVSDRDYAYGAGSGAATRAPNTLPVEIRQNPNATNFMTPEIGPGATSRAAQTAADTSLAGGRLDTSGMGPGAATRASQGYDPSFSQYGYTGDVEPTPEMFTDMTDLDTPFIEQYLTPEAQATLEAQQRVERALSGLGEQAIGKVGDIYGSTFRPQGLPEQQFRFEGGGPLPTLPQLQGQARTDVSALPVNFGPAVGQYGMAAGGPGAVNFQGLDTGGLAGVQTGVSQFGTAQGGPAAPTLQGQLDVSNLAAMPVQAGTTAQEAIMSRLEPQLQRQRAQLETQLANQGLVRGGEAYNAAVTEQAQRENDLRTQAALQGIQLDMAARQQGLGEAQALGGFANQAALAGFGAGQQATAAQNAAIAQNAQLALQSGQFANQAQAQQFAQRLAAGEFGREAQMASFQTGQAAQEAVNRAIAQNFAQGLQAQGAYNAAAAQQFGQEMDIAGLYNAALAQNQQAALQQAQAQAALQAQGFNQAQAMAAFQNAQRQAALQEQLALRAQPLNEIAAIMGGAQVQLPQFQAYQGADVAAAPVFAGTQAAGQFAQQNYANQIARQNAQMGLYGSLAGMAGTALGGQFGGALGKSMFGG